MVGYISETIARALKSWDALRDANVSVVRPTDGTSVVVNTPLPAIIVHVNGTEGEGNTFIGGGIRFYFEIGLYYVVNVTNFTFTADNHKQAELLDLSEEIVRCMERSPEFKEICERHDFSIQFDRFDSETTYATSGVNSVTVDVHKIMYNGSVEFDPFGKDKGFNEVTLKKVNIETNESIEK